MFSRCPEFTNAVVDEKEEIGIGSLTVLFMLGTSFNR